MSRVAAATTTPTTTAAKQENSRNSLTISAMMPSVLLIISYEASGGLLTLPNAKRTPIPWPKRDSAAVTIPAAVQKAP
jgi:hypothetical protein